MCAKMPKMPEIVVSLRSIFVINTGYFQHKYHNPVQLGNSVLVIVIIFRETKRDVELKTPAGIGDI